MKWTTLTYLFLSIILIILQACVLNHVCLFGYAVAFAFIYIILALPPTTSLNLLLTIGFLCGLAVDVFTDTLGVNTISCTVLSALKNPVFKLYSPKSDDISSQIISTKSIGLSAFSKYAVSISLIYCVLVFILESYYSIDILKMICSIICSTLFTFIIILAINFLNTPHEKRL